MVTYLLYTPVMYLPSGVLPIAAAVLYVVVSLLGLVAALAKDSDGQKPRGIDHDDRADRGSGAISQRFPLPKNSSVMRVNSLPLRLVGLEQGTPRQRTSCS